MKKNFVLDTNVLLHDPRSIFAFDDNNVVIPIYVIEEIDNFKRDLSSLGRNARQVSRYLDEFRVKGKLKEGVSLGEGKGTLRVLMAERHVPGLTDSKTTDDRILAVALWLFWRSHHDLGANWSPSLEIGEQRTLPRRGLALLDPLAERLDGRAELLGHLAPDAVLGTIFASFCIGK